MDSENLVSILILAYNNLQYMKDCLDSIFIQEYSNIEIIFSDDCSEEFDEEKIRSYIETNNQGNIVNYIINSNKSNYGIVKNFNTAIKLSSGDIIVHIAVDDAFFDRNVIKEIVKFHEKNDYLIAVGYLGYHDENLDKWQGYTPLPKNIQYINGEAINCYRKLCEIGSFFPSPGLSYKRELIDIYGYYDEDYKLIDDLSRFLYLTRSGCKIGFIDRFLIKYRTGGVTTSEEKSEKVKELIKLDMKRIEEKEILPYRNLFFNNPNVEAKNINNISFNQSNTFNQKTVFNGDGRVIIGKSTTLGYDLSPHFLGFYILLQARYPYSIIKIGSNTIFSNDVTIIAVNEISIGDNCLIGDRVTIFDCDFHEVNPDTRRDSYGKSGNVIIGNNVWIGTGVTILKGVKIGDNSIISANSVVTKDIANDSIAAGNPAKIVGSVYKE